MSNIQIAVSAADAAVTAPATLTSGMVGATVTFAFSGTAWQSLRKIAVFRAGSVRRDVEETDWSGSVCRNTIDGPTKPALSFGPVKAIICVFINFANRIIYRNIWCIFREQNISDIIVQRCDKEKSQSPLRHAKGAGINDSVSPHISQFFQLICQIFDCISRIQANHI